MLAVGSAVGTGVAVAVAVICTCVGVGAEVCWTQPARANARKAIIATATQLQDTSCFLAVILTVWGSVEVPSCDSSQMGMFSEGGLSMLTVTSALCPGCRLSGCWVART